MKVSFKTEAQIKIFSDKLKVKKTAASRSDYKKWYMKFSGRRKWQQIGNRILRIDWKVLSLVNMWVNIKDYFLKVLKRNLAFCCKNISK